MRFPDSVVQIVNESEAANPDDIEQAVADAVARVRRLPDFRELADRFFLHAVQQLVYQSRHRVNRRVKNAAGCYGAPPVVPNGASPAVNRVNESVYQFRIGSRTLGSLRGAELNDIATAERESARGHMFNFHLLTRLVPLVPADSTVQESVSEQRLRRIMRDAQRDAA